MNEKPLKNEIDLRFDVGKETIQPDFKGECRFLNPNIDYIDGVPYLGFWIPSKIRVEAKPGIFKTKYESRLFLISGKMKKMIPHDAKELSENNLFIKDNIMPTPLRWNEKNIGNYVSPLPSMEDQLFENIDLSLEENETYFRDVLEYSNPHHLYYLLVGTLKEYIDFRLESDVKLIALWIMQTYFIRLPCFNCSPYLSIGGSKRTGKTKLQTILSYICFNAVLSINITTSSLFRIIDNNSATMLIDETERLFRKESRQDFRNVLLGGLMKGAGVFRTEESTSKKRKPTKYDVYGNKSVSSIAGIEDVLNDRCVPTTLIRSTNQEILDTWPTNDDPTWPSLRNKLYLLYLKHATEVIGLSEKSDYILREATITSRSQLLWKPIITMALLIEKYSEPGLIEEILELAKEIERIRTLRDEIENNDVRLVRILSQYCKKDDYYSLKNLRKELGEEIGEEKDGNIEYPKWLTSRFVGRTLRRLGFDETRLYGGYTQYKINPSEVECLITSMGVSVEERKERKEKEDQPIAIDNNLLRKPCAICRKTPETLYLDKNREFYICKECKKREGNE